MRFAAHTLWMLLLGAPAMRAQQGQAAVVRGRVFRADSTPIAEASVTLTGDASAPAIETRAARNGLYNVTLPAGWTTVTVTARAIGYQSRARSASVDGSGVVLIDLYLPRIAVSLDTVRVATSRRRRPSRQDGIVNDPAGSTRGNGTSASLLGNSELSVADMAASAGAITGGTDANGLPAFSVLGLGSDQNSVVINGMSVAASALPRDAIAYATLSTNTYDPARGGFSGGQLAIQTLSGGEISRRDLHWSIEHPTLQSTPGLSQLGRQFTDLELSASADGPIRVDRSYYSASFQIGQRVQNLTTLPGLDAASLQAIGLDRDSVRALTSALSQVGLGSGGWDGRVLNRTASGLVRGDATFSGGRAASVIASARVEDAQGVDLTPTSFASSAARVQSVNASLQGTWSQYTHQTILNETRGAVSALRRSGTPDAELPAARVLTGGGEAEVVPVAFGGDARFPSRRTVLGGELQNETSWYSLSGRHRVRVTTGANAEHAASELLVNSLGSFGFSSIGDLAAGRPSSFSRSFGPGDQSATALGAFVSIGDNWLRSRTLRGEYGIRLEGSGYAGAPARNPAVEEAFGVRTDRLPAAFSISPRAGFTWSYGNLTRVQSGAGEPRGTLRGGIGRFVNRFRTGLAEPLSRRTGLVDGRFDLSCVGAAAPVPDWRSYLSDPDNVPTACVAGSSAPPALPTVSAIDEDFAPSSSWRANLGWAGTLHRAVRTDIDAVISLNSNQPRIVDENLASSAATTLPQESGRPVFVSPGAIDAATGTIPLAASRRNGGFGLVAVSQSDLLGRSGSIAVTLAPASPLVKRRVVLTYIWSRAIEQTSGITEPTAGDPRAVAWTRAAAERRHQIIVNGGMPIAAGITLEGYARVLSGAPFTPIVLGDVNGDGRYNDRAFVFDPARTSDTSVARAMSAVLGGTAGKCLRGQIGVIAATNSCTGPWTVQTNLELRVAPERLGLQNRLSLSVYALDIPAALDRALHGSEIRGWGQSQSPDPTLLRVTGFDQAQRRYIYQVNTDFGRRSTALFSAYDPFRLVIHARLAIGADPDRQILQRQLEEAEAVPGDPSIAAMREHFERLVPNAALAVLRERDSLALSGEQVTALRQLNSAYVAQVAAIWTPFAEYLAGLKFSFMTPEALVRFKDTRTRAYRNAAALGASVRDLLTPDQIRQLPSPFLSLFNEEEVMRMRNRY